MSVPITKDMWKSPDDEGQVRLDGDKVMAEALEMGSDPETIWVPEGEPRIEHHPIQKPPPYLPVPKPN